MKRTVHIIATGIVIAAPMIVFAETVKDFRDLVKYVETMINLVVPIIFGIAMLSFLWGVYKYVIAGDVKSKAEGRTFVVYGIIGLAIMLSVWALAYFVKNSFFRDSPTTSQGL